MEDRIKQLEEEICYLKKEIEKLKLVEPEIHYYFTFVNKKNPTLDDYFGGFYDQPTD